MEDRTEYRTHFMIIQDGEAHMVLLSTLLEVCERKRRMEDISSPVFRGILLDWLRRKYKEDTGRGIHDIQARGE